MDASLRYGEPEMRNFSQRGNEKHGFSFDAKNRYDVKGRCLV